MEICCERLDGSALVFTVDVVVSGGCLENLFVGVCSVDECCTDFEDLPESLELEARDFCFLCCCEDQGFQTIHQFGPDKRIVDCNLDALWCGCFFLTGNESLPYDLAFLESGIYFLVCVELVVEGDSEVCDFS